MLKTKFLGLVTLSFLFLGQSLWAIDHEIKFSVLAPEGSTWVKELRLLDAELREKSGQKLGLKIYAGGVSGDEKDVIRKMRIGQVQAAAFTGVGLGSIVPSVRVLELPFLFENASKVDAAKAAIRSELEAMFQSKGFVLLGWSDAGFVNIFSNKPIKKADDLKGVKMWAWEGDPLAKAMADTMGIAPIPLALPDVLTSLQTNLIDAVYGPPAGVVALQWFTKTKYMTELRMANSVGALLISANTYNKLPADLKTLLKSTADKYARSLTAKVRAENDRAVATLKNNGITVIRPEPAELEKLKEIAKKVRPKLVGTLYSQGLLSKVEAAAK